MTLQRQRIASPVGELTLVGGDAGLRAVLFAGEAAPADAVEGPHPVLDEAARQLGEWFAGERTAFDVPLDLAGATAFQHEFLVHRRQGEACPRCGSAVVKFVAAGRGTYACETCQPRPRRRRSRPRARAAPA